MSLGEMVSSAALSWVQALARGDMMSNWHAAASLLRLPDGQLLPLAVGRRCDGQSYVCSPQAGYIDYARDEVSVLADARVQRWSRLALSCAAPWLSALSLDEAVSVNAWGVSTHLYPEWTGEQVDWLTRRLRRDFPDRPLWLRTLNARSNAGLMAQLRQCGWQLWPSRQVYVFDGKQAGIWMARRNNQLDQKLLDSTPLRWVTHDDLSAADAPRLAELYAQLYLHKHSRWNLAYQPAYFARALEHRWLTLGGFRDEQDQLVAFIGIFARDGVLTTPVLGYDTTLPKQMGLYRLVMAQVLRQTATSGALLNLGAGAADFKRLRGGEAEMEWHGFYAGHLPWWRRQSMVLTGRVMADVVPRFLQQQAV